MRHTIILRDEVSRTLQHFIIDQDPQPEMSGLVEDMILEGLRKRGITNLPESRPKK
jgi:hypothetical protein